MSLLEALFWQQLVGEDLVGQAERELVFAPPRKFRFDFAWAQPKVAAEIEGGTWVAGAHTRGRHFESDCEKYNLAASLGWRVFRFTNHMVQDGRAIAFLSAVLKGELAGERNVGARA